MEGRHRRGVVVSRRHRIHTGVDGPLVPGALSFLNATTVSTANGATYMLDARLGRFSSVVNNWEERYDNSIDEALEDQVFDGLRADAERAYLRTLWDEGTFPRWLKPELWERNGLEAHLNEGRARCASFGRLAS